MIGRQLWRAVIAREVTMPGLKEFTSRWWAHEEAEFRQRADDLQHVQVTDIERELTEDKSVLADGSDPETGALVVTLPRVKNVSNEFLEEAVEDVRSTLPKLEIMFERREMTAEFVTTLRRFHAAYGFIWSAVCYIRPHIREARVGRAGGDKKTSDSKLKRLVALAFLAKATEKYETMKEAEYCVAFSLAEHLRVGSNGDVSADLLRSILKKSEPSELAELKSSFTSKRLTLAEIRAFDHSSCDRLLGLRELLDRPLK